jgi:transposase
MSKIREILQLSQTVEKIRPIARAVGKSRTAVEHVLTMAAQAGIDWPKAKAMSDSDLQEVIYPTKNTDDRLRYQALQSQMPLILKNLGKKHMTLQAQWEVYRLEHPEGYEYSRFCDHLRTVLRKEDLYLGMDYGYGEMAFLDFAGSGHYYMDRLTGERVDVHLFVSVLPASQFTYAEFTPAQKTEHWISATENSVRTFGGGPQTFVPDCAKAVVSKADRYLSEIQTQFWHFADYYGAVVTPARPGHPRDKALVESSINNIYRWVYPRLARDEYFSLAELNEALRLLMAQYNARRMRQYQCSRQELFEAHERATLRPLPQRPYEFKHYQPPTRVAFNGHLWLKADQHYYSVPERYTNLICTAFYTPTAVEIYHENCRVYTHARNHDLSRRYTTVPEHLPRHHLEYMTWTPERFQSFARESGNYVEEFIVGLLDSARHFTHAYKTCMGLMKLRKRYGDERLDHACQMVLGIGSTNAKRVAGILECGADKQASSQIPLPGLPQGNPNLRHTTNHKERIA